MRAIIRVVDCETTGLDVTKDKPVEICCCDLLVDGSEVTMMMEPIAQLCDPGIPIPAVARAVHHIGPADVAGKPAAELVARRALMSVPASSNPEALPLAFCAHNAEYDRQILENTAGGSAGRPWIDTWRLAKKVWPQLEHHGNEVLRYELFPDDLILGEAHRALHDVHVTVRILLAAFVAIEHFIIDGRAPLALHTVQDLVDYIAEPIDLSDKPIGFGKYDKLTWRQARNQDRGYLQWMVREHNKQLDETGKGAWDVDQWHTIRTLLGYTV